MLTGISMRAADVVRALSPTFATEQADARLAALAARGREIVEREDVDVRRDALCRRVGRLAPQQHAALADEALERLRRGQLTGAAVLTIP